MRFRKPFLGSKFSVQNVIDNNLMSIVLLCKAFIPVMLENKFGKIINISSIAGTKVYPTYLPPSSKIRRQWINQGTSLGICQRGININAIAAGFCAPIFEISKRTKNYMNSLLKRTPMEKLGGEILKMSRTPALYLASEVSSFVTGEILHVDGGWSAS